MFLLGVLRYETTFLGEHQTCKVPRYHLKPFPWNYRKTFYVAFELEKNALRTWNVVQLLSRRWKALPGFWLRL